VNAQHILIGRRSGHEEIIRRGDALRQKSFTHQAVLLRRKNVRAQIQIVALMINQFEWQHDFSSLSRSLSEGNRAPQHTPFRLPA